MSTVRCTCQHDNDAWRRYCGNCAAELAPMCASCGFANRATDKFCGGCARPNGAVRASQQAIAAPLPRVPRPPVVPPERREVRTVPPGPPPKSSRTITGQTASRNADRLHNKTTVPIDRFDVVSETVEPR